MVSEKGCGFREEQTMEEKERDMAEQVQRTETEGLPGERAEKKAGRRFRLTGSTAAKIIAFFLLVVSSAAAILSGAVCYVLADAGMYLNRMDVIIKQGLRGEMYQVAFTVRNCLQNGFEESARQYLAGVNAEVAILDQMDYWSGDSSSFLWQSYESKDVQTDSGFYSELYDDLYIRTTFFLERTEDGKLTELEDDTPEYIFRVFLDPDFPLDDDLRHHYEMLMIGYRFRFAVIGILAGSMLLFAACFVFLLCSAGHRNGREGIIPGFFTGLYFDVLTVIILAATSVGLMILTEPMSSLETLVLGCVFLLVEEILIMLWLMDLAIRLKLGKWWRHTLIYVVLRAFWRGARFLWRGAVFLVEGSSTVLTTVIVYLGICIAEFLGCIFFVQAEGVGLWAIEKLVLFFGVLYLALTCRKLLRASEELTQGNEDYHVDTSRMFGAFKEHGENLNSLGQGISRAVAQHMKSERLKTELITNVSHDLKTPLTSIINYANLICQEETENPRIGEYSEVLLRQSERLKKLLEDLVEASKATTGNLEVNLEPCEVGVLLTQAVGEYQRKMAERELELRDSQPEETVRIMADGRHLWRVFDNLLNNICKYAQEKSRVYLSVEQKGEEVFIIFRNMSKYALNISPEELEERFVRGDKSRHMEGNGLGLSIAKSLTELQNGKMHITIDGDLFKVTLVFHRLFD